MKVLKTFETREPSETDYAAQTGLFFRKVKAVGKWLVTGEEGGGKKGYLCLVPPAKLQLPMLQGLLFKKCYNQNDSTFIKFVFEVVIEPSFSIT